MKKHLFFLIILLLLVTFSFSHGGRIDSDGGHYNWKTGEYHYHGLKNRKGWLIFGSIILGSIVLYSLVKKK